jgi:hypothetical protein
MKMTMSTTMRLRGLLQSPACLGMFCLALSLSQGCARPEPLRPTDAGSPVGEQKLPFHPEDDQSSANDAAHPVAHDQERVSPDPKLAAGLPFRAGLHARILPSGTLLTVQLEDALSTNKVHAGDAFTASVAAPLTIDGDLFIERGTPITGHIESAQSLADRTGLVRGSGYFRLTLNAMTVEGRQLVLQTSSLFARGTSQHGSVSPASIPSGLLSDGVQVEKGRRLTFRLTAPVTLDDPNSMANRQSSGPIPE